MTHLFVLVLPVLDEISSDAFSFTWTPSVIATFDLTICSTEKATTNKILTIFRNADCLSLPRRIHVFLSVQTKFECLCSWIFECRFLSTRWLLHLCVVIPFTITLIKNQLSICLSFRETLLFCLWWDRKVCYGPSGLSLNVIRRFVKPYLARVFAHLAKVP